MEPGSVPRPDMGDPRLAEKTWDARIELDVLSAWKSEPDLYRFDPDPRRPVFIIDTPPPYPSGSWHIGAVMAYSSDPYAFFSVEPPELAAQFKNKSIRAPFRVGEDIHAVSRATLTVSSATRAVRDSARAMAKLFLNPADVK